MRAETSGIRLSVLGVTVMALFAALFGRLWFLQVAAEPGLELKVVNGSLRTVSLPPTRGRILDAVGRVLADNRPGLGATIERNGIRNDAKRAAMWEKLAGPLHTTQADLEARYKDVQNDPLLPVPLAEDLSEFDAIFLRERNVDYPGVAIVEGGQRSYRYSPIASNIVGYMGKIQKGSEDVYNRETGYAPNDLVGIYGIERSFEKELRGKAGSKTVEIDSNNRVVRVVNEVTAEPGNDVQLTIDIRKQQYVELILNAEMAKRRGERPPPHRLPDLSLDKEQPVFDTTEGAVVLENASNGEIMAMTSNPGFDNRWYDGKTDGKVLQSLFGSHDVLDVTTDEKTVVPNNNAPLVDRSISTQFAIGSTMKLFTSAAGLRSGLINSQDKFTDTGKWTMPNCKPGDQPESCDKGNAGFAVYGKITLAEALSVSSDTFFYDLGARLWTETGQDAYVLQKELRSFGMGSKLGIRLPSENAGLVPDKAVKKALVKAGVLTKFAGSNYFTGDNVNLAIGQGFIGITPLQLANGYASFANGGTVWKPRIAKALYAPGTPDLAYGLADLEHAQKIQDYTPEKFGSVDLPEEITKPIREGLRGVLTGDIINGQPSTAGDTFRTWDFKEFPIWGKTGTAQVDSIDGHDTSLFASFGGPKDEPSKYAVASIIRNAGFGGQASAPLVKCIWTVLQNEALIPQLPAVAVLDKSVLTPRVWAIPADFDASCLNVEFTINRREN